MRGNVIMTISNKFGWMVLTTGNESDLHGYATLYGDMAGGFAVIKDVPKTLVYVLVERRNERAGTRAHPGLGNRAPALGRAPPRSARQRLAARLRPARPHPRGLRRARPGPDEMAAAGLPGEVVDEVIRLVDRSEYKRRQAAPGIRITPGPSAATAASRSPTAWRLNLPGVRAFPY